VFLVNSRLGHFAATPGLPTEVSQGVPLLPKLRGELAEFLNGSSLARLRIFLLAYLCRCAVRADCISLEAFLGPSFPRFAWPQEPHFLLVSRFATPGFSSMSQETSDPGLPAPGTGTVGASPH
jgi:hypothetical protein